MPRHWPTTPRGVCGAKPDTANSTCQHDHWRRGHKQICKKIHRGGNAEQYHADKKYKEAVAVAVEACAADTKGQKCYLCLEAVHPRTGEGLVRGCACGDRDGISSPELGVAHVSCLAEQAKILVAEVEENNPGHRMANQSWKLWYMCGLCEQEYHGVVRCASSWACWKTYVGRPEEDWSRKLAMGQLANGLAYASHHVDSLSVREAELSTLRRLGSSERDILTAQTNLAMTYRHVGRHEESIMMKQDVYFGHSKLNGEEHQHTLTAASNYALALVTLKRFEDAKSVLRKTIPVARRVFGEGNETALIMRFTYSRALYRDTGATLDDISEAVTTLEEVERTTRRVMGIAHPLTASMENTLREARAALRARSALP